MKNTFKRVAAAGASAALIATGMSVAVGTGVASAYDASTCTTTAQEDLYSPPFTAITYYGSKTIENDGEVAPDGTIAFVTKIWGEDGAGIFNGGAEIYEFRDFAPEGFKLEKFEVNGATIPLFPSWGNETDGAVQNGNKVTAKKFGGWSTAGGTVVSFRTKYKAPSDIEPGTKIDAGGFGYRTSDSAASGHDRNLKDLNLCLTVRKKNLGESVNGSLDDLGFGSLGAASTSSSNLFGDPSSPLNKLSDSF